MRQSARRSIPRRTDASAASSPVSRRDYVLKPKAHSPKPNVVSGKRKGLHMNRRLLGVSVVLATTPTAASLSTQQKKSAQLTAWGEPDLQGTYTNQTLTPLERPASLGTKAFLTKEEAAALEK